MTAGTAVKILIVSMLMAVYVGCSSVNFSKDDSARKCQDYAGTCLTVNGKDYFDDTFTVGGGLVDILIVNDNSASMSFEQANLSKRLANFVGNLEAKHADYRIAITTTDISSPSNPARAINANGALQDGKLIQFSNGQYFLTAQSGTPAEKDAMFRKAIERQETLACESFILNNYGKPGYEAAYVNQCPSGDERGIYAANLTLKNNPNSFIRPNANLAIIFLADEDERSQLYMRDNSFALESLDEAATLIKTVNNVYPGKVLSAHSIITATASCLTEQNGQMVVSGVPVVNGSYGSVYYEATRLTKGVVGDICEQDFTGRLGQIQTNILERIKSRAIACENPTELKVTIIGQTGVTHTVVGREVRFNTELSEGVKVRLQYACETL